MHTKIIYDVLSYHDYTYTSGTWVYIYIWYIVRQGYSSWFSFHNNNNRNVKIGNVDAIIL